MTAIDYEYEGMPATLPAGAVNFKLTNAAPKEEHMLALQKLSAKGEAIDIDELLALPEKKRGPVPRWEHRSVHVRPGRVRSGTARPPSRPASTSTPASSPQPGKKGQPHFMLGMKGTLTVQ